MYEISLVRKTLGMLNSLIACGDVHSPESKQMYNDAFAALDTIEKEINDSHEVLDNIEKRLGIDE